MNKISYVIPVIIFFLLCSTTAYAEHKALKTDTLKALDLFEEILKRDYEDEISNIKEIASQKGYDIFLTMESVNPYPFKDYNYTGLIAAYATAKKRADTYIADLDFVDSSIKEKEIVEKIPEKISLYKKISKNTYMKEGFTYINENATIDRYVPSENGMYIKDGTQEIILKEERTKYGEVTLSILQPEDIFQFYKIKQTPEVIREYEMRKHLLEQEINNQNMSQEFFLSFSSGQTPEDAQLIESILNKKLLPWQQNIVYTSTYLIGRVPYEWGGKSKMPGYDPSWYTFTEDGKQKGLDCSGFVQWVYRTSGFDEEIWKKLLSTSTILKETTTIDKNDLEIGDLGLLNNGESINHVGIYLGDDNWIHCSSSVGTVSITQNFPFKIYKKVSTDNSVNIDIISHMVYYANDNIFSEEEIYLASQAVAHEARGEGLNGWIAVAQVIKNRFESEEFPNTIKEIIYEHEQFENIEEIKAITPPENLIKAVKDTLNGNLQIFEPDKNILFFRNAKGDTSDWGSYQYYTTIGNQQFYTLNDKESIDNQNPTPLVLVQ